MSPAIRQLASEALSLEEESRAELASLLLLSLDEPVSPEDDLDRLWLEEANRRYRELASGAVEGRPWDEVLANAHARLR